MVDERLVGYMRQAGTSGRALEKARSSLLKQGYDPAEIDDAISFCMANHSDCAQSAQQADVRDKSDMRIVIAFLAVWGLVNLLKFVSISFQRYDAFSFENIANLVSGLILSISAYFLWGEKSNAYLVSLLSIVILVLYYLYRIEFLAAAILAVLAYEIDKNRKIIEK